MCTRYYMEMSPELRPIVEKAKRSALTGRMIDRLGKPLKTDGEIRPTDMAPVIAPDQKGNPAVFPGSGYVGIWFSTQAIRGGYPLSGE